MRNRVATIVGSSNTSWIVDSSFEDTTFRDSLPMRSTEPPPVHKTSWAKEIGLEHSTTYHWQVVAYNSIGLGVASPSWSFTTQLSSEDFYHQIRSFRDASENMVIEVENDLTLNELVSIPTPSTPGVTLTIRSANPQKPVTLTRGISGNLITIGDNSTLILEDIIIDGGKFGAFPSDIGSVIDAGLFIRLRSGVTYIQNKGTIIKNNNGNGVSIERQGNTFIMNGGEIIKCYHGVYSQFGSTFTMLNGTISNNIVGELYIGGNFTLSGGNIIDNRFTGVNAASNINFTMSGGNIRNNGHTGLEIDRNANVTISGGFIGFNEMFELNTRETHELNLNGGVIAGIGKSIKSKVNVKINHNIDYPANGIVILWDRPENSADVSYTAGTNDDIIISPEDATVVWGISSGLPGIFYTYGANTGFIEIIDVRITP